MNKVHLSVPSPKHTSLRTHLSPVIISQCLVMDREMESLQEVSMAVKLSLKNRAVFRAGFCMC